MTKMQQLRSAVRQAIANFIEHAPPNGHGKIDVKSPEPGEISFRLEYKRIDKVYGIYLTPFTPAGGASLGTTPLDTAHDKYVIAAAPIIQQLFDVVVENSKKDSSSTDAAINIVEQFNQKYKEGT